MTSGASDLRLLQAIAGGEHGGAEAFFVRLTLALARAGVDQHILVRGGRPWLAALGEGGLRPVQLAFGGWADFTTRAAFKREIKAFAPHVVMTWMNRASTYCPASVAGRSFTHVARLGGYYDLKYYRSCDHLIGNTEDIVRYVRDKNWPAARSHYIPNFVSAAPAPAVSRAELETPERAPLVLALGRLHVNKAFDVLLQALADAKAIKADDALHAAVEEDAAEVPEDISEVVYREAELRRMVGRPAAEVLAIHEAKRSFDGELAE